MNMICLLLSTTKGRSITDIILIMPDSTTRWSWSSGSTYDYCWHWFLFGSGTALTTTSKSDVGFLVKMRSSCWSTNKSPFRVTHSSFGACLNSAAYMCFYVKRLLDYKPVTTPSYVLMRETEAAREKELEKEKELARMKELEDDLLSTV